jgi:pyruvate kinase
MAGRSLRSSTWGPKLRIGTFKDDARALVAGANFVLDADPAPGDLDRVYFPHPEIFTALRPGHRLLLDDGKIRLAVLKPHRTCRHAGRSRRQAVRPRA